MAHEIERKFLVLSDRLPPLPQGRRLVQGYLSEHPQVRFRVIDGESVVITVKKTLEARHRLEFEFRRDDMNKAEIDDLSSLALWPPLTKVRHRLIHEGLLWEVDVYEGENAGLITADVELPSPDYSIEFPQWIDSEGEITGHKRYSNLGLTRQPLSRQPENPENGRSDIH